MASPLEGALAAKLGRAMAGVFLDATLSRTTTAEPEAATPWIPGAPTTTNYPCKAIHEEWGARYLAGGLVLAGERKVLILASTLAVDPTPGDSITIRGETFIVAQDGSAAQPSVATDPAKATWTLRAKA